MKKKTTPRTTRQPLGERSVNVPSNVVPIKGKQQKKDKNDDAIVAFVSFSGHVTGCFFVRLVEYLSRMARLTQLTFAVQIVEKKDSKVHLAIKDERTGAYSYKERKSHVAFDPSRHRLEFKSNVSSNAQNDEEPGHQGSDTDQVEISVPSTKRAKLKDETNVIRKRKEQVRDDKESLREIEQSTNKRSKRTTTTTKRSYKDNNESSEDEDKEESDFEQAPKNKKVKQVAIKKLPSQQVSKKRKHDTARHDDIPSTGPESDEESPHRSASKKAAYDPFATAAWEEGGDWRSAGAIDY